MPKMCLGSSVAIIFAVFLLEQKRLKNAYMLVDSGLRRSHSFAESLEDECFKS